MEIWHSIVLGIVEGITEFLPISSTGHLILFSELLNIKQSVFTKSFEIIIQLGAIASVVFLYWKTLWNWAMIKKLLFAFVPTAIIGLVLYSTVKTYLLGNSLVVVLALAIGGIVMIVLEKYHLKPDAIDSKPESISYKNAFIVGLFQTIAMIPGVSRSASTIIGGQLLGLKRKTIVEFSFLLAVPTMIAASGLDLFKSYKEFEVSQFGVLAIGFVVSFIVALFSIKFLLKYIQKHNFVAFGVYRIIIAILFWLIIL